LLFLAGFFFICLASSYGAISIKEMLSGEMLFCSGLWLTRFTLFTRTSLQTFPIFKLIIYIIISADYWLW
jgi:hypothetical protein